MKQRFRYFWQETYQDGIAVSNARFSNRDTRNTCTIFSVTLIVVFILVNTPKLDIHDYSFTYSFASWENAQIFQFANVKVMDF